MRRVPGGVRQFSQNIHKATFVLKKILINPALHETNIQMHHFVEQKCANMRTFLLQIGVLWDLGLVHCGICATGLLLCRMHYWVVIGHAMMSNVNP